MYEFYAIRPATENPTLEFAWEYVNIVVTSRCFSFRVLITQARIWKSFWVQS